MSGNIDSATQERMKSKKMYMTESSNPAQKITVNLAPSYRGPELLSKDNT